NERGTPEHHHHDGRDDGHHRQVPGFGVADRQRDQHRRNEDRGRGEDAGVRPSEKLGGQERRHQVVGQRRPHGGGREQDGGAGSMVATKNRTSGPRSSASLSPTGS